MNHIRIFVRDKFLTKVDLFSAPVSGDIIKLSDGGHFKVLSREWEYVKNGHGGCLKLNCIMVDIQPQPIDLPVPPLDRLLRDGSNGICISCGSSLHNKFIFWDDGCIQPKCSNYYKKEEI